MQHYSDNGQDKNKLQKQQPIPIQHNHNGTRKSITKRKRHNKPI